MTLLAVCGGIRAAAMFVRNGAMQCSQATSGMVVKRNSGTHSMEHRAPVGTGRERKMTQEESYNDLPAPEGYIFVADVPKKIAHLTVADEQGALTLCGAGDGSLEEFTFLPHVFQACGACLSIADEASTHPR